MNRRILVIVSCALALSVCVSFLVFQAVSGKGSTTKQPRTTPVVVAARDLEVGSLIHDGDLKTVAWSGPVPKGSITKPDSIRGRGVASPIYEGEPVTETRLAQRGSGGGLAGTIPSGMRACAVRVNEVVGVAGFAVPGMRVDVLISGSPPGGNPLDGPRVRTLLQNIQVLSAGTNFQRDQEGKPEQAQVVTLLVTPSQAEILSLASNETRIQLVLRNPMDTELVKSPGTMVSDLFGGARAPEPSAESPSPHGTSPAAPPVPTATVAPTPAPAKAVAPVVPDSYVVDELNGAAHTQARFTPAQEKP